MISNTKKQYSCSIFLLVRKVFSQTERTVMETIYTHFGQLNQHQLSEHSHLYPEWKKQEQDLQTNKARRRSISIIDFFENPAPKDNNPVFEQSTDLLQLTKELYLEEQALYVTNLARIAG